MKSLMIIVALLFIALKVTGDVDWSWWLVLAPSAVALAMAAGVLEINVTFGDQK